MNSIIATGILYGEKITVTIVKGEESLEIFSSDKELLSAVKIRFSCSQDFLKPIYGCFLFPKNTLASAELALKNRFFDNDDYMITVHGELEKMPCEEGWFY